MAQGLTFDGQGITRDIYGDAFQQRMEIPLNSDFLSVSRTSAGGSMRAWSSVIPP